MHPPYTTENESHEVYIMLNVNSSFNGRIVTTKLWGLMLNPQTKPAKESSENTKWSQKIGTIRSQLRNVPNSTENCTKFKHNYGYMTIQWYIPATKKRQNCMHICTCFTNIPSCMTKPIRSYIRSLVHADVTNRKAMKPIKRCKTERIPAVPHGKKKKNQKFIVSIFNIIYE